MLLEMVELVQVTARCHVESTAVAVPAAVVPTVTAPAPPAGRRVLQGAALRRLRLPLSFERTQTAVKIWSHWKENQRMDGAVLLGIFFKGQIHRKYERVT